MRYVVVLVLAAILLAGSVYELRQDGFVMLVDDSYEAEIVGTSRHGFASPDGLVVLESQILLADEGGSAVWRWSPERGTLESLASAADGIMSPEDLVVTDDGTIFFTDDDAGGLWRISPEGVVEQIVSRDEFGSTEGIALAADGTLFVGDAARGRVVHVSQSGEVLGVPIPEGAINKPESMAFDDEGNLYIADDDANALYRYDLSGGLRPVLTERDGIQAPESMCFAEGALWITDDQAGKLYRYDRGEGLRTIALFAGKLKNVQGVAVGPGGDVYVTIQTDLKRGQGCIVRLSRNAGGSNSP
jgi:sugar lactone lactonase YvrE